MQGTTRSLLLFGLYVLVGFAIEVMPFVDRNFVAPFIHSITSVSGGLIDLFGGASCGARERHAESARRRDVAAAAGFSDHRAPVSARLFPRGDVRVLSRDHRRSHGDARGAVGCGVS
mgnify:CR=1 FL=1